MTGVTEIYTYQDFLKEQTVETGVQTAISMHMGTDEFKIALDADLYDHQRNRTINEYVRLIYTLSGTQIEDFTASNNKIASNFFHRLNTQRCTYLLGNGVSFSDDENVKDELGSNYDMQLKTLAYAALIHGISFAFWNVSGIHVFKLTEFAPLWDEETGALRAGVRFWQIDKDKPMYAVLYEEDGYTKYRSKLTNGQYEEIQPKRAYQQTVHYTDADGEEVIGEQNYGSLPIIPLWGSSLKQSTLVGMQRAIDSFDLIRSGFANDLTDCATIYWILGNAGGMTDTDMAQFRDRLKLTHIATVDEDNSSVTPYTQDIPYAARQEYLNEIRSGIYEDFGGLDVHTVEAGATNDHIDAAYQPLDEEADDFEYQILQFHERLFELLGFDTENTPVFLRNRISNQLEQTQMVLSAAEYLDEETVLKKLPFITVDEIEKILKKKIEEDESRFKEEQEQAENNFGNNEQNAEQEENEDVNG